jgi:hypothetical protein
MYLKELIAPIAQSGFACVRIQRDLLSQHTLFLLVAHQPIRKTKSEGAGGGNIVQVSAHPMLTYVAYVSIRRIRQHTSHTSASYKSALIRAASPGLEQQIRR